jgi:hypothetical protein
VCRSTCYTSSLPGFESLDQEMVASGRARCPTRSLRVCARSYARRGKFRLTLLQRQLGALACVLQRSQCLCSNCAQCFNHVFAARLVPACVVLVQTPSTCNLGSPARGDASHESLTGLLWRIMKGGDPQLDLQGRPTSTANLLLKQYRRDIRAAAFVRDFT